MATLKTSIAARYHPQDLPYILTDIEQVLSPSLLLKSYWLNTQSLNQKNAALLLHWQKIKLQLAAKPWTQIRGAQAENELNKFSSEIDVIIKLHQILAGKKMALIHLAELIEFFLIACAGLFLYYYSKKQIALPIKKLVSNAKALKERHFAVDFPAYKNEIGLLSQGMNEMSQEIQRLIEGMQSQVKQKTEALEKANKTIEFLFSISQQLNTVRLTSPILFDALNALAKQANLRKVCLELNNGTFVNSALGCASLDPELLRIPIIINGKPYGFLNYVTGESEPDNSSLIESFTGLVARALYQEEHSLQAQKILLMEERGIIARELHDSIAQSLSFLKIQCTLLDRQVSAEQQAQAKQTINNIEDAVSDSYKQLRALLSTFRLSVPESNFKEALLTMIKALQLQTSALISIKQFAANFYTDASQHIHLLQIVREAIINAMKHAHCTTIEISCIITNENKVWISIIDDGLGIKDNAAKVNHYGLAIMQQRADELGATLSLNPLAKGTEVELIFPYKKPLLNQGTTNV
ncbi:histidine kinase [Psychromonas sp.]|uniref:histidine kinase n=1 Tax=Psychromonas sp. TaxID=1884585 RepID=UPI0039E6448C